MSLGEIPNDRWAEPLILWERFDLGRGAVSPVSG
jgi:hypothetical protein